MQAPSELKDPRFFKSSGKSLSELSSDRYVIIRIWLTTVDSQPTNAKNAIIKGRKVVEVDGKTKSKHDVNVGHVSLQTPKNYISLWPNEAANGITRVVKSTLHELKEDIEAEGHEPHHVIYLYSLDIEAIDMAFQDVVQSQTGWTLLGDSSLADSAGHSCATLACSMLNRGKIDTLLDIIDESSHKVSNPLMSAGLISPNEFAEYILRAKKKELEIYPNTISFPQGSFEVTSEEPETGCRIL